MGALAACAAVTGEQDARAQSGPAAPEALRPLAYTPTELAIPAASEQTAIRTRQDVRRAVKIGTVAALGLTAAGGVIIAVNKPTLFGDGRCRTGGPIFGQYGCDNLPIIHGIGA